MKWLRNLLGKGELQHEREVLACCEEYGFHITNVAGGYGDSGPDFSYTAGFPQSVGQPDVIVFGQPLEGRVHMLGTLFEQCNDGLVLADFVEVHDLIRGHRCVVREVLPGNFAFDWFKSAMWYQDYRTGKPMERAMQLVWPSAATGLFPWDMGCAEAVGALQPPLYEKVVAP